MIDVVIHSNFTNWGHVWHIITTDGKGHIQADIEYEDNKTIFFSGLSVVPDVRDQGIGKALLAIAENLGKDNDVKRFRLNIEKPKTWLYDYYIKQGYEYWDEDEQYIYLVKYNEY